MEPPSPRRAQVADAPAADAPAGDPNDVVAADGIRVQAERPGPETVSLASSHSSPSYALARLPSSLC